MFTYFFTHKIYNFFKSGMLLDFFFKKFIYNILYSLFIVFNIFFSEKYIVEYTFLKSLVYIDFIFNSINKFSFFFSTSIIGTLFIISIITVVSSLNECLTYI